MAPVRQSWHRCGVNAPNSWCDPAAGRIKARARSFPLVPLLFAQTSRADGHPSLSADGELGGWRMSLGGGGVDVSKPRHGLSTQSILHKGP